MRIDSIILTIIAVIAVLFGYPYMGQSIILIMAPLVAYMVFKQDAEYLPALMIQCTSCTMVMYAVLFSMMIVCFKNTRVLMNNKYTRYFYSGLLIVFPLYILLTSQRYSLDGDTWQAALTYSSHYLSFWAFLYCYIISHSFNERVAKSMVITLVSFAVLCILARKFEIKLLFVGVILGIVIGFVLLLKSHKKSFGLIIGFIFLFILLSFSGLTFTVLFTFVYASLIAFLAINNRVKGLKLATGILAYVVIVFLMVWGILHYNTAVYGAYSDSIDFHDLGLLFNRLQYKLFDDRALFWDAGLTQLEEYKPFFPMHDIPNFTAYGADGHTIDDVSFGAHNTPLQLLRIFGFLMGGVLIVCYMIGTIMASKFFISRDKNIFSVSLFSVSIAYTVLLFLTGTAAMLPDMALFSFGLLGLAFGQSIISEKVRFSSATTLR